MSTEPFIGEVKLFSFNFAPRGYSFCAAQTMSIAEYTALFSLIGTTYGGNGTTTFLLPDLRGRVPIGQGHGIDGTHSVGEAAGSVMATMTTNNMPNHIHSLNNMKVGIKASNDPADENSAAGLYPGIATASVYTASPTANVFTGGTAISGTTDITGAGAPFGIENPYLVMNFCIALEGIFPSRN